ncbi:MAG: coproporphyrinogen dehydrogenase HemZ [Clostridiales bacterium]|nr:coproporphyrinogen dehydrogenase HemZ [Clostridiales bacterium]MDD7034788.1 coproporphyrinogen dehydrogenase HemZ [Bacillota bacterium]MDY2921059.1 coproporphyrinogen dehydrogenase HemZ [Lentihominibacter sp.]
MYRFRFDSTNNTNRYEELIKVFLRPEEYEICRDGQSDGLTGVYEFTGDQDRICRELYRDLTLLTGKSPKWGILTGIRPVKLAGEIRDEGYELNEVRRVLEDRYLLDESKSSLAAEILDYQRELAGKPANDSISLYVGIPFCPTRCLYCSFTSNQVSHEEITDYLEALKKEIKYCGEMTRRQGRRIESLYIGGGTPTSLSAGELDELLELLDESFDLSGLREYTVEAGRPDTISEDKLRVMKDRCVGRISINPQTTKESTLELIGRRHTIDDFYRACDLVRKVGIETVNTDLIAGLPGEDAEDFTRSVRDILATGAENITLHTLAVKRASALKEMDENFSYRNEDIREKMLTGAHEALRDEGYRPYYLYRQKHTTGNTENIGFCRDDRLSLYNVRIMEEAQSILALGAGGISKVYYPEENRLERVANVSNYRIYIDRIDEMLERKENGFFIWR